MASSSTPSAKWTDELHQFFVELCANEVIKGNMVGTYLNKEGWGVIHREFVKQKNKNFTQKQFRNHWKLMKGDYKLFSQLKFGESGLGWNEVTMKIEAPDIWWIQKAQENPKIYKFRNKDLSLFMQYYHTLFGDIVATGAKAKATTTYSAVDLEVGQEFTKASDDGKEGSGDSEENTSHGAKEMFPPSSLKSGKSSGTKRKKSGAERLRVGLDGLGRNLLGAMSSRSTQKTAAQFSKKKKPALPLLSWYFQKEPAATLPVNSLTDGLKKIYEEKLKPVEICYGFNDFSLPYMRHSEFEAKPMVLLLGPSSTGKTTFITDFLKCKYPGAQIGPEPTTDRVIVIMFGPDDRSILGNTAVVRSDLPFSGLTTFGAAFLSKFECYQMPHDLLESFSIVDTPGQEWTNFINAIPWFASKCDSILLLFDPSNLDITDQFERVISSLRGHESKIRVVLNKADQVDMTELMRVYGALTWSLSKVLSMSEVVRVYVGSFNGKPIDESVIDPMHRSLIEKEQTELLAYLKEIPKRSCDRLISEFVKRARDVKVHALIVTQLRKEIPALVGKAMAQSCITENLEDLFNKVQKKCHLPASDLPDIEHFREVLSTYNFGKLEKPKLSPSQVIDDMLAKDIPELISEFNNPFQ